jgi:hypothetical protein
MERRPYDHNRQPVREVHPVQRHEEMERRRYEHDRQPVREVHPVQRHEEKGHRQPEFARSQAREQRSVPQVKEARGFAAQAARQAELAHSKVTPARRAEPAQQGAYHATPPREKNRSEKETRNDRHDNHERRRGE